MSLASKAPARFVVLFGVLLAATFIFAFGADRARAADPGVVEVYGYQWEKVYKVQLSTLQGRDVAIDGQVVKEYGMRQVLDAAEAQSGDDFTVASLSRIEVSFPGNQGKVTYDGDQIRNDTGLATFYVNDQNVTVMRVPGRGPGGSMAEFEYSALNPQLYEPRQAVKAFSVAISPVTQTIRSGSKVTFTASVAGLASGITPTFAWSVNGAPQSSGGSTFTGTFKGKPGESLAVSVRATAPGYSDAYGGAQVIILKAGKKPDKKKPPKKKKTGDDQNNTDDQGYYDPGYYDPGYADYYDDGSGTGTGSGAPSTGSPSPSTPEPKQQQEEPAVEPSGETVTGQLIDPTQIATVVPPAEDSAAGASGEDASPDDGDSNGGGIPGGVKTAFGIGALLGLGGLAEAGAFSGAWRRFRFRFRP